MKRRLFWKILIAFWLTFFAIMQGVWLLFELNRDRHAPPDGAMARVAAPVMLASAAELVAEGGPAAFTRMIARLPAEQRDRLALAEAEAGAPAGGPAAHPDERLVTRAVTAPDGRAYELRYRYGEPPRRWLRLNMPPEMLVIGLLGGLLFSAVLAWYLTEPINRLRGGFERLARGNLGTRLGGSVERRRDEIADLAQDFDRMAQRLEQLVGARDRLLHDVSHELRSPLARLQLAIGLARQSPARLEASLDRIDQEARRLDGLVGELLALARAEHGAASAEDYFDLAEIVRTVVEDARFEAQASGVVIRLEEELPPEEQRTALSGHAELVRRAIDNILRNALRFSTRGQSVSVRIGFSGEAYRLVVADQGPGIDEAILPSIFDPFVRGDGAGLGLGLAIAQRSVVAHGGQIMARNDEAGGLVVVVTLPTQNPELVRMR